MSDAKGMPNNPDYRVLLPEWEGGEPLFKLSEQQRKSILGGKPHRVAPQDKSVPVHERASTCEALLAVYPDAISVGSVMGTGPERGDVGFGGWVILAVSIFALWVSIYSIFFGHTIDWAISLPAFLFFSAGSFHLLKSRYYLPKDQPILFNRKTQQVTFSQIRFHPFWKFWVMPGFEAPVTVPWEAVQARSYKFVQFMGETVRDSYRLELWASSADDPKIPCARAAIGYLGWYEDEQLWRLYEHIRRYMEEDGPAIQPGEALRKPKKGRDLIAFPEEVLATLGGPALSEEQVEALAHVPPPPPQARDATRTSFLPPRKG
ncbi:DUF6708 domain-containing protein [Stenotrophomonas sp. MMGLT7]|uniref:DUF6708 domain-containing protein n=1 Tax=Stenotrophomonas sp. MMGLT7 TaxID=2901227 RepID=UPI001E41E7D3|nr:DUF6708 domain-containing protein [Stenotrophomonas sp. MMGLT7]MCD7099530.1 hypothetical protein [Stenotrophomonas sp. MMGLT7]